MSRFPRFSKYGGTIMTWPVISRICSHSLIVGTETPRGAARSVLLRIWPCRLASSARNRRNVTRSRMFVIARTSLQVSLEIRSEPQCSGLRTCQYFWKAAVKHIHLRSFRNTERKKLQDGGPAGHRFGDVLHQRGFLRSSE